MEQSTGTNPHTGTGGSATANAAASPDGAAAVDNYISQLPPDRQDIVRSMRAIVCAAAPQAQERIGWGMPSLHQGGWVVHYAMGKNHIGLYPGADGVAQFASRLTHLKTSKGAIQFPLDKPLPRDLITDIVRFKVAARAAEASRKRR